MTFSKISNFKKHLSRQGEGRRGVKLHPKPEKIYGLALERFSRIPNLQTMIFFSQKVPFFVKKKNQF